MRCYICDFSDSPGQSMYYNSLVDPKGARNRRITLNKDTGETICTVCAESILSTKDKKEVETE